MHNLLKITRPNSEDTRAATGVTSAIVMPIALLLLFGAVEYLPYALFAAICSAYGRYEVFNSKLRMQIQAAMALVLAEILGTITNLYNLDASIRTLEFGLLAFVISSVSSYFNWQPSGPIFPLFAFGATSGVKLESSQTVTAIAISVLTALFAISITILFDYGVWKQLTKTPDKVVGKYKIRLSIDYAFITLLAVGISEISKLSRPYWAAIAAVAPFAGEDANDRVQRSTYRMLGTLFGLLISFVVINLYKHVIIAIIIICIFQFFGELFITKNYAIAFVFITPMALLINQIGNPIDTNKLIFDRFWTTLIGTCVSAIIAILRWDTSKVK